MADTAEFFSEYLPKKLADKPELRAAGGVYQFDITGAGTWSVDLSDGSVTEGPHHAPGCKITADKATWEAILDKPAKAAQMFMMGKMKATNLGMATQLQKILG